MFLVAFELIIDVAEHLVLIKSLYLKHTLSRAMLLRKMFFFYICFLAKQQPSKQVKLDNSKITEDFTKLFLTFSV